MKWVEVKQARKECLCVIFTGRMNAKMRGKKDVLGFGLLFPRYLCFTCHVPFSHTLCSAHMNPTSFDTPALMFCSTPL